MCVCVCSSAIITCAKLRHSVTMPLYSHERSGSYWTFAGSIGQDKLVLCCLDGERVVGSDDNSVLASFDR